MMLVATGTASLQRSMRMSTWAVIIRRLRTRRKTWRMQLSSNRCDDVSRKKQTVCGRCLLNAGTKPFTFAEQTTKYSSVVHRSSSSVSASYLELDCRA
jgi:hypothetical protein